MHVTDLVVRELGLTNHQELGSFVTINGVTIVDFESSEGHFRVHLVRDSQYLRVKLEEGATLASYYNSLFWHEISTAERFPVATAHFKTSFRVADGDVKHSVYVTRGERKGSVIQGSLGLKELEQVAREIGKLHSVQSNNEEFQLNVQENYGNIRAYKKKIQKDLLDILGDAVKNQIGHYFQNPGSVMERVGIVMHHLENQRGEELDLNSHRVITHGRLAGDVCKFDEERNLVEITEWENIHIGNPVEDLTHLLVSSADVSIRRKKFMKVFQVYFYTLVDIAPPKYQLTELKRWFKEYQAQAVIDGIESLLLCLSEGSDEELKQSAAYRWETSLEDTVDFLTGNYISDDEHTFFSHKEDE